jgi:hypothetical protein
MAINKKTISLSEILNDLNNGLTWLESENVGFGSIQSKYGANEQQIAQFRKHPKLANAEPNITIFQIVDDLVDNTPPQSTVREQSSIVKQNKVVEVLEETISEDIAAFESL